MIKFFRKIRQKLLSENKFSKYLIYALGEIVLVVIGILIALQINNWNEAKKNQVVLNTYKERLIRQFKQDSLTLSRMKPFNEDKLLKYKKIDSILEENYKGNVNADSIINFDYLFTFQKEFISATTVIDELFRTGRLDLFKDSQLKDLLAEYKNSIESQHDRVNRTKTLYADFDKLLYTVSKYSKDGYLIKAGKINSDYFMNFHKSIYLEKAVGHFMDNKLMELNNEILILLSK